MSTVIDARKEIEALVAFGGRGPGTDAERRAAQHLRGRLESLGRGAELEATWIRPNWPLVHTAFALFGVVASIVATRAALAGAIIAGVLLVAAIVDLGGRFHLARLLTGRRGSQNVVSPEGGGRPGTLVLVAHYDAGRSGAAFGVAARLGRWIGPFWPMLLALAVVLAMAIVRAVGTTSPAIDVAQFAATAVLIVCVPLLAGVVLSSPAPAANDNASGVATVLRLAERYGDDLEHFDVWVVLTGGEEAFAEGITHWLRRHRRELDRARTVFLSVDAVGSGTVRYTRREGPLLPAATHPRLFGLCEQIAAEDEAEGRYGARPISSRSPSDAAAIRRARFPVIGVSCRGADGRVANAHRVSDVPDAVDDEALERAFRFCSELIELVDERIGPDLSELRDHADVREAR